MFFGFDSVLLTELSVLYRIICTCLPVDKVLVF